MAISFKLFYSLIIFLAYREAAAITYDREHDFGPLKLHWKYHNESGKVYFKAIANATGWFGVGFTTNKGGAGMKDYDMAVCGVLNSTKHYIHDLWSTSEVKPFNDSMQDFNLTSAKEEDGKTTVEFWRIVDTGDTSQDVQFKDKAEVCLVYAFHPTDDAYNYSDIGYHGKKPRRGHMKVCNVNMLGGPVASTTEAPSTTKTSAETKTRAFFPLTLLVALVGMLLSVS